MRPLSILLTASSLALSPVGGAQTHRVAQAEAVVRAIGVYEWIGDRAQPAASRFIPVSLFIDGALEDAGVYLARPIPFALETGTIYEIDRAGVSEGTLNLSYVSHLRPADVSATYDGGWFGYGIFVPPAPPKKTVALKESKSSSGIVSSKPETDSGADRPTFGHKTGAPEQQSAKVPRPASGSAEPSRPKPDASADSAPVNPADDPDRPHLSKKPDQTSPGDAETPNTSTRTGATPENDADRPTLKKRTPEQAKKARKEAEQSSARGLATSLNDDPNRPVLHRGRGEQVLAESDMPKLKGVPIDLKQAIGVSDAKTRPQHDFSRPWADETEHAAILSKMQGLARSQLSAKSPMAATSPVKKSSTTGRRVTALRVPPKQAVESLSAETLNGFTLSYGGPATYVYSAQTAGEGSALKYVTIVAQIDALNQLRPALQNVTDAAHLDSTPWMRFVDAVDAEASNRASLLFELRGATSRQFALYRVIAARAEQTFLSGTTE